MSMKVAQSCDVISRQMGDEVVLLDLASGTYFGINASGATIWTLLTDGGRSVSEICDVLREEFDVSKEDVERDVMELCGELIERGLLVPQEP